MGDRTILHSDMNCFYASVEMLHHPEFAGKPLAVGGDPEARHGIVLTANYIAKKCGVKTGMALWQAKQVCPEIIFVPPRMDLYLRFSSMAREIYSEYTDKIEPYGIDEGWLDVTESSSIKGDGMKIAQEISDRIKYELGITVSIGISWNKIFAKLGSDYKKPDAITQFHRGNYKEIVWGCRCQIFCMLAGRRTRNCRSWGSIPLASWHRQMKNCWTAILEKSVWCYGHLRMDMILIRFVWKDMKLRSSPLETVQRHRETWKQIWMYGSF